MQVYTTITVDEPAPGLKTIVSFVIPNQKSGKVELQYLHEYAGINTGIGLTGNFTKCNTGLSFCTADLTASLALNDQGDTVSASYCHTVKPVTNTAVDAELTHSFSGNENTLTIGITAFVGPIDHGEGSR